LVFRTYDVRDLVEPTPEIPAPWAPERLVARLKAQLGTSAGSGGHLLEHHRGQLLVNHTETTHRRLQRLLTRMRSDATHALLDQLERELR
jgi:hypothetical protein